MDCIQIRSKFAVQKVCSASNAVNRTSFHIMQMEGGGKKVRNRSNQAISISRDGNQFRGITTTHLHIYNVV